MNCALIVAAGKGTRMGPDVDKLFLDLAGIPLVVHTWKRFDAASCIGSIVVVVRDGMQQAFEDLAALHSLKKPFRLAIGGKERQDSVWNGLMALPPECRIVAIQDAARPCATEQLIADTIRAASTTGAAVAAQRVTDTLKESSDGVTISQTVDRSRLWSVQTPQTFRVEVIQRALSAVRERNLLVTDDTAACELIGQPVQLVESRHPNPKATSPADIPYLEWLLAAPKNKRKKEEEAIFMVRSTEASPAPP
jgi:2-C-methyl-D-erythritol 4-phosphate cytidylyltransferase